MVLVVQDDANGNRVPPLAIPGFLEAAEVVERPLHPEVGQKHLIRVERAVTSILHVAG